MRYITNMPSSQLASFWASEWYKKLKLKGEVVLCDPKATEAYTQEKLKKLHIVGIYVKEFRDANS